MFRLESLRHREASIYREGRLPSDFHVIWESGIAFEVSKLGVLTGIKRDRVYYYVTKSLENVDLQYFPICGDVKTGILAEAGFIWGLVEG